MKITRLYIAATALFLLNACKSAQTKQMETEYRALIESLATLQDGDSAEQPKFDRIAERLKVVLDNTSVVDNDEHKRLAADLLAKVPSTTCSATTTSAGSAADGGLNYSLALKCNQDIKAAHATLSGEGLQFAQNAAKGEVTLVRNQANELQGGFALAQSAANIGVAAEYRGREAYDLLARVFALNAGAKIDMQETLIALAATNSTLRNSYATYADANQSSVDQLNQATGDFAAEAEISESGQFTVGATYKGQNYDLMYGHPNGVHAEGIGTSFTTVRIDGQDFRLGRESQPENSKTADKIVSAYELLEGAVTVRQILTPISRDDAAKISIAYEIVNNDTKPHTVGIRLLLDTWAGSNDGVPFLLPIGKSKQLYEQDIDFTPSASLSWQTFDATAVANDSDGEHVFLYNQMAGKDLTPPNRVVFTNWGSASSSTWDYEAQQDGRTTGDSAVLLWWNPRRVQPNKQISIGTMLGIIVQKKEPTVFITDANEGFVSAYLYHQNNTEKSQNLKYAIECKSCSLTTPVAPIQAKVEPGAVYINSLLLQVNATADANLRIRENIDGTVQNRDFPLDIQPAWNQARVLPAVAPHERIPVHYYSRKALALRARLLTPDGKSVQSIRLKRKQWGDGYNYEGAFTAPALGDGAYAVEVYK